MRAIASRRVALALLSILSLTATALSQENAKPARCQPGPGASGSPRTIEAWVDLVNSLPKPVTVPCLLASLDRPLRVFAVNSTTSLQFSTSADDPRIFIFYHPLIISVTSDGPGADLVEVSVMQPGYKSSLKGELRFPQNGIVERARPYDRIRAGSGTTCGAICHGSEVRDETITFTQAFISRAIRPSATGEVSLDALRHLKSICKPEKTPARCELLEALFAHGPVLRQDFPDEMMRGL